MLSNMKNMRSVVFGLSLFLATTSCGGKYPSWYMNVQNQEGYLNGVASGVNFDDAKNKALSDVASKISTTVNTNTRSESHSNSYGLDYNTMSQNVNLDITDVSIVDYKVVNKQKISEYEYIVEVSVSKEKLFTQENLILKKMLSDTETTYSELKNKNILEQYNSLIQIKNIVPKIEQKVSILSALKPFPEGGSILAKMQDYKLALDRVLQRMTVYIDVSDDNIKSSFASILSNANIKIVDQISSTSQANLVIMKIKPKYINSMFSGLYMSRLDIEVNMISGDGKQITASNLSSSGSSAMSHAESSRNAANNLSIILVPEKLTEFFGLHK